MEGTRADPLAYFEAVGRATSETWSSLGRGLGTLADAAERALATVAMGDGLDALGILAWAGQSDTLPRQSSPADAFGQPPLIVHREADFFVQALIWMEGTTAIHQHGFAGAFMVAQGSSLHVEHGFTPIEYVGDDRLAVGELSDRSPEVLRPGAVRRIDPGSDFIHALFHLEQPTVTIVVRNTTCGLPHPQYSYRRPGLAWDGLWEDRTWSRRVQSLDVLTRLDPEGGRREVHDLVGHLPVWEAFSLVDHWTLAHGWNEVSAGLTDRLVTRAPPLAAVLGPALERDAYARRILFRRGMLKALHQRVLLALLANLPDADSVTAVLRDIFPDRVPAVLLLDWVEELSAPALRGVSGLSLPVDRIDALRASPVEGREHELLAAMRTAWGDPQTAAGLYA